MVTMRPDFTILDEAFPPDECDPELGDAYATGGVLAVFNLCTARSQGETPLHVLRLDIASQFGVSPGDVFPYDSPLMMGYNV